MTLAGALNFTFCLIVLHTGRWLLFEGRAGTEVALYIRAPTSIQHLMDTPQPDSNLTAPAPGRRTFFVIALSATCALALCLGVFGYVQHSHNQEVAREL